MFEEGFESRGRFGVTKYRECDESLDTNSHDLDLTRRKKTYLLAKCFILFPVKYEFMKNVVSLLKNKSDPLK